MFKIDDKVVCIDDDCYQGITRDKVYVVQHNEDDSPNLTFVINDSGECQGYFHKRFKLFKEQEMSKKKVEVGVKVKTITEVTGVTVNLTLEEAIFIHNLLGRTSPGVGLPCELYGTFNTALKYPASGILVEGTIDLKSGYKVALKEEAKAVAAKFAE